MSLTISAPTPILPPIESMEKNVGSPSLHFPSLTAQDTVYLRNHRRNYVCDHRVAGHIAPHAGNF